MVIVSTIRGDLLDASEPVIVQQCNCLTRKPHGLSKAIAGRFPYADVYTKRPGKSANVAVADPAMVGSIELCMGPALGADAGAGQLKRPPTVVACLFAQWTPGKCGAWASKYSPHPAGSETPEMRAEWFRSALERLDEAGASLGVTRMAVPYQIGCGLAGGDWGLYEAMLNAARTEFVIYRLPG